MKDKTKIIPTIVTISAFGITKFLIGTNGNPMQNILIAALVGGLIGGSFAAVQFLLNRNAEMLFKLGNRLIFACVVLAVIGVVLVFLFPNSAFKKNKVTLSFSHCVLTHSFLSQAMIANAGFWKKDVPGFKINCEATGKKGCEWGLNEQEICKGYDSFSELRCVKHPDDASNSSDFIAMWPIGDEKPKLQEIPLSPKDVNAHCRLLDNSCDISFNVYAANNNNDVEYVQCSGTYHEN